MFLNEYSLGDFACSAVTATATSFIFFRKLSTKVESRTQNDDPDDDDFQKSHQNSQANSIPIW